MNSYKLEMISLVFIVVFELSLFSKISQSERFKYFLRGSFWRLWIRSWKKKETSFRLKERKTYRQTDRQTDRQTERKSLIKIPSATCISESEWNW